MIKTRVITLLVKEGTNASDQIAFHALGILSNENIDVLDVKNGNWKLIFSLSVL